MEEKKRKSGKKVAAAALIAAAVIAAGIAAWVLLHPAAEVSSIKNADGVSQEELDRAAKDSVLWISASNAIYVDAGTMEASAKSSDGSAVTCLDNIERNSMDMKYTITLSDSGKAVYESEVLSPGQGVSSFTLSEHLDKGSYAAKATAQGVDRETHRPVGGTVSANIELIVE